MGRSSSAAECQSFGLQSLILTDGIQHVHLFPLAKMAAWFGWGFVHINRGEKEDCDVSTTALIAKRGE